MTPPLQSQVEEILDKLELMFEYYHKSYDASAGTQKIMATQAIMDLLIEARKEEVYRMGYETYNSKTYKYVANRIKQLQAERNQGDE